MDKYLQRKDLSTGLYIVNQIGDHLSREKLFKLRHDPPPMI